jgi:2-(1,2-epoxy-1,2-dihydrophenyl)acetyl-CoA isomerase
MSDGIDYQVADAVATITMNRPEALNALTVAMKVALIAALQRAAEDDGVRAVVVTGAGRGFCVGQDLKEHVAGLESGDRDLDTVTLHYNPIVEAITSMPKPVIAAVNGPAAGAGAAIAFACDLRIAAESGSFMMAFSRIGLGPDSGSSWTLQRLIGSGRAMAMLLLADTVHAAQALEMGLVSAVVPAETLPTLTDELAAKLANGATVAYGAIKDTVLYAGSHTLTESLAREASVQSRCGATEDHLNAAKAFLAKTPATFSGR